MSELPYRHRITVEEYYRMGEAGLFAQDARVELIQGEVFDMPPIGCTGAGVTSYLTKTLMHAVGDRVEVRVQSPVRLSDASEPQPDLVLARQRADGYRRAHPTAEDILLVVEVSDSTLHFDLEQKLALYATHRIPEYWVVDLKNNQLRICSEPIHRDYRKVSIIEKPGLTPFVALPGSTDLSGLFLFDIV